MRFGAALDLWHKGDLHDASEEQGKLDAPADEPAPAPARKLQRKTVDLDIWVDKIADCGTKAELQALWKTAQAEGQPEAVLSMIVQAAGERAA